MNCLGVKICVSYFIVTKWEQEEPIQSSEISNAIPPRLHFPWMVGNGTSCSKNKCSQGVFYLSRYILNAV